MAARPKQPNRAPRRKGGAGSARIALLVVFLLALFGIVAGRLMWLQLVEAKAYAKAAEAQRTQEIVLTPRRGPLCGW